MVAGRSRVPSPATGTTAMLMSIIPFLRSELSIAAQIMPALTAGFEPVLLPPLHRGHALDRNAGDRNRAAARKGDAQARQACSTETTAAPTVTNGKRNVLGPKKTAAKIVNCPHGGSHASCCHGRTRGQGHKTLLSLRRRRCDNSPATDECGFISARRAGCRCTPDLRFGAVRRDRGFCSSAPESSAPPHARRAESRPPAA